MGQGLSVIAGEVTKAIIPALPALFDFVSKAFSSPPVQPPPHVDNVAQLTQLTNENLYYKAKCALGPTFDGVSHYNIGIVGASGAGKSTLLNALRGLPNFHEDAAPADCGGQTTMGRKSYSDPQLPYVKLWDLPGGGTTDHPSESYFIDNGMCLFDYLLVVNEDRLTQFSISLLRAGVKFGQPVALVFSKSDERIAQTVRNRGLKSNEAAERLRQRIRDSVKGDLAKANTTAPEGTEQLKDPKVFVISSYAMLDLRTSRKTEYLLLDELALLDQLAEAAAQRQEDGQTLLQKNAGIKKQLPPATM